MPLNLLGLKSPMMAIAFSFLLSSCAHYAQEEERHEDPNIVVDDGTEEITGWFLASGEWTLFPGGDFERYYPYPDDNARRCVSLVNGTMHSRNAFAELDRRMVTVYGVSILYDHLPSSENAFDRFLERKHYNGEVVFNFCVRDYVFLVRSIEPHDRVGDGG